MHSSGTQLQSCMIQCLNARKCFFDIQHFKQERFLVHGVLFFGHVQYHHFSVYC